MGEISPLLLGVNHRFPYSGFGMWDAKNERTDPLFLERFRYGGFTIVRFPGGRTANNYRWKNAIGELSDRKGNVDAAFGRKRIHQETLTNEFGPDEFGTFIEEAGVEGNIVVNFATGSANEAAEWVEYMNTPVGENPRGGVAWADVRAANGHPDPYGIKHWEIGNELAGVKTFWIGDIPVTERAPKYIFGGSTLFERSQVVTPTDYSLEASVSTGEPSQRFFVPFPPIQAGSETVFVGDEEWQRIEDLASAGDQPVYEVDYPKGRISFGDGTNGRVPPTGTRISVTHVSGRHDGFLDFYREMKEVDPSVGVGSALNSPVFTRIMGSEHPYDFMVAHSYSYFHETPGDLNELHDLMMTLPDVQAGKVESLQRDIAADAGDRADDVDVLISEWAMAAGENIGLSRLEVPLVYAQSLDGGLYTGLMLRQWIRLGIPIAQKHSLIDIDPDDPPPGYEKPRSAFQALIGPQPCYLITAPAHVFRIFKEMTGPHHIQSEVIGGPIKTIFNGASLPSLSTIASTADGKLYLIVINTDRDKDIRAVVETAGFDEQGEARFLTLAGDDYMVHNTEEHPNRVVVREATYEIEDGFEYVFPRLSVTAIELTGS